MSRYDSHFGYRAVVSRDCGRWVARVVEVPGVLSRAHTLRRLDAYVRDVIGQAAGLSASAVRGIAVEYEFRTGDVALDRLIRAARSARRAAVAEEMRARVLTEQALNRAGAQQLSRRDLAVMLDISHQRVHQLAAGFGRDRPPVRR